MKPDLRRTLGLPPKEASKDPKKRTGRRREPAPSDIPATSARLRRRRSDGSAGFVSLADAEDAAHSDPAIAARRRRRRPCPGAAGGARRPRRRRRRRPRAGAPAACPSRRSTTCRPRRRRPFGRAESSGAHAAAPRDPCLRPGRRCRCPHRLAFGPPAGPSTGVGRVPRSAAPDRVPRPGHRPATLRTSTRAAARCRRPVGFESNVPVQPLGGFSLAIRPQTIDFGAAFRRWRRVRRMRAHRAC